jgi:hypothetical protein
MKLEYTQERKSQDDVTIIHMGIFDMRWIITGDMRELEVLHKFKHITLRIDHNGAIQGTREEIKEEWKVVR